MRHDRTVLSEDVVWAYLAQITLALYDCHSEVDSNGKRKPIILHRDIKPENGQSCRFFTRRVRELMVDLASLSRQGQ